MQQLQRKAWPVDAYVHAEDFEPIFELLQRAYPDQTVDDLDDDAWAEPFVFKAQELVKAADSLFSNNSTQDAIDHYM